MKPTNNMTPEYAAEMLGVEGGCDCIECVAKRVVLHELDRLRAELSEARRLLDEARGQVPVGYIQRCHESRDPLTVRSMTTMFWPKRDDADVPVYLAAPVPPQPAVTDVCRHCLPIVGEELARRCPVQHNMIDAFNGDAPMPNPSSVKPAVPGDEAKDAARYRFLKGKAGQGAVRTLLPLTRCHYVVVNESAYDHPTFDSAVDAAIEFDAAILSAENEVKK